MKIIGRGTSARSLRSKLRGVDGVVNWTGSPNEDLEVLNANTETHKFRQLERLSNADIPTVGYCASYVSGWFGRTYYHSRGRDFSQSSPVQMGACADFWTQPIASIAEFRVHVFRLPGGVRGNPGGYEARRVGWKVRVDDSTPLPPIPIRSRAYGWRLSYYATPDNCRHEQLKTISKWAIAILGWDFGCVDVLRTQTGFLVLEANSCPGLLDQKTLDTYVDGIKALTLEG